jgi:hypothetical protein
MFRQLLKAFMTYNIHAITVHEYKGKGKDIPVTGHGGP